MHIRQELPDFHARLFKMFKNEKVRKEILGNKRLPINYNTAYTTVGKFHHFLYATKALKESRGIALLCF
jgi:hypothetical protein